MEAKGTAGSERDSGIALAGPRDGDGDGDGDGRQQRRS